MTKREREILDLIRINPLVTQQELAESLGIQRSSVAGLIRGLTQAGHIKGRGYFLNPEGRVVVIGGANMDIQGRCTGSFVPGDSNPGEVHLSPGGVGRNAAENLARLSIPVTLLTVLGDDEKGRQIRQYTSQAGVDMSRVLVLSDKPTSTYLSLLDERGDLQGALSDMAITSSLTPDYLKKHVSFLEEAALIMVDTNVPRETLEWVAEALPEVPLFADPVSGAKAPRLQGILHRLNCLKPNLKEAEILLNQSLDTPDKIRSAGEAFLSKGVQSLVLSLGGEGVFFASRESSGFQEPPQVTVKSVNGSGDAFWAALCAAWLKGYSLEEAARWGMAGAALTLESEEAVCSQLSWEKLSQRRELW